MAIVNMFFDTTDEIDIIQVKNKIFDALYQQYSIRIISLYSSNTIRYRYIFKIYNEDIPIVFDNCESLMNLCIKCNITKNIISNSYLLNRTDDDVEYHDTGNYLCMSKEEMSPWYVENNSEVIYSLYPIQFSIKGKILCTKYELSLVIPFVEKVYMRTITNYFNYGDKYIFTLEFEQCFFKTPECKSHQCIVYANKKCYGVCLNEKCRKKIHKIVHNVLYPDEIKIMYISEKKSSYFDNVIGNFVHNIYKLKYSVILLFESSDIHVIVHEKCLFTGEENHDAIIYITLFNSIYVCETCDKGDIPIPFSVYPNEIQDLFIDIHQAEIEATKCMKKHIDVNAIAVFDRKDKKFKSKCSRDCIFHFNDYSTDIVEYTISTNGFIVYCNNNYTIKCNVDSYELLKVNRVLSAFYRNSTIYGTYMDMPLHFFSGDEKLKNMFIMLMECRTEKIIMDILCHDEKRFLYYNGVFYVYKNNLWIKDNNYEESVDMLYNKIYFTLSIMSVYSTQDNNYSMEKNIIAVDRYISDRKILKKCIKQSESRFMKDDDKLFDNNNDIIPFINGVYEISSKEIRPHKEEDYVTKYIFCEY